MGTLAALRQFTLIPLVFLLFFSGYAAKAKPRSEPSLETYWRELSVPFSLFEKKVTNEFCYRSFTHFQACIGGINAVLTSLPAPMTLGVDSTIPARARVRQDFGLLKARDLNEDEVVDGASRAWVINRPAWDALFRLGPGKVDFPQVVRWVRSVAITPETESEVTATALNGFLVFETDPHTRLIPARFLRDQRHSDGKRFVGVGVNLRGQRGIVTIQSLIAGSPAEQVGLQPYDELTQIDGEPLASTASVEEATRRLQGAEGTPVNVHIRRRGQSMTFRIVRKKLVSRPISERFVTRETRKWGVIRIQDFARRQSCEELRAAVSRLSSAGAKGFVVDVRDNPGGLVTESVCALDIFLGPGKRVVTVQSLSPGGERQAWNTSDPQMTSLPVVLLVNAATASAAEIFAGALQDYQRAVVVGVRTFGKGSVQDVMPWTEAKGVDYLYTMARFYLPSGRAIQRVGIVPDWETFSQPKPTEMDRSALREEDRYPNPLPAESGPPAPAPAARLAALGTIQTCVKTSGQAEKRFETGGDYPLFVAEDVLGCEME